MTQNKNIIELKNITVEFDDEQVLRGINLYIRDKEFVTLLGPSGCGKTTTLRIIAGFVDPNQGEVLFEGKKVNGVPPYKRQVNTIFQRYALFPHLNVYENIAFGLRLKKTPEAEVRERVKQMLALVNLEGYERRSTAKLSGGQQQRVLLARALCAADSMLLCDEPVTGLDPEATEELYHVMDELNRRDGMTVVMISHDPAAALRYASHILYLGEPVYYGTREGFLATGAGQIYSGRGNRPC